MSGTDAVQDAAAVTVRRGAAVNLLARGIALPMTFLFTVVTSRWLLPSGRGALTLALLTSMVAGTLLGNTGAGISNAVGRGADPRALVRRCLAIALPAGGALALLVFVTDLLVVPHAFRWVAVASLGVVGLSVVQIFGGALLAEGAMRLWGTIQVIAPTVTLIGTLICVVGLHQGAGAAAGAWAAGQLIAAVVAGVARPELWRTALPSVAARGVFALGLRLGVVNIVSLINYRVEVFVVQAFRGVHDVGIYSLASTLAELVWFPVAALSAALVAPALRRPDAQAGDVVARGVRHAYVLALTLGAVLAPVAYALIPIVFGVPFESSRSPFLILLPGTVVFAPASVFAVYFSLRLGQARYALTLAIISASTTFVGALLLVGHFGASGAAFASALGYAVSVVVCIVWFRRTSGVSVRALVPRPSDLSVYREVAQTAFARVSGRTTRH